MDALSFDNPIAVIAARHSVAVQGPRRRFDERLTVAAAATERAGRSVEQVVRQAAEQLVATTLVQPILAAVRNDPFKSELFHGGLAEDMFGSQLDTLISERITRATRLPIVDAVYDKIMRDADRHKGNPSDANRKIDTEA
ncbi:MAG: hypothetical protein V3U29_00865 [Phycisphaeraceae bacterium]